jgi:hypothetical protein
MIPKFGLDEPYWEEINETPKAAVFAGPHNKIATVSLLFQ